MRQRSRRELAALISAAQGVRHDPPGWPPPTCPDDLEGRYRLAVETFDRLVGEQLAVLTTISVRLSMGLPAGARDAIFTHSLRSYDAVMLALADEAAARAGAGRHLASRSSAPLPVGSARQTTGARREWASALKERKRTRREAKGPTGAHVEIRTRDLFLTKEVLCRLSYVGPAATRF